jgi:long-chain acyl-CoA synthetase
MMNTQTDSVRDRSAQGSAAEKPWLKSYPPSVLSTNLELAGQTFASDMQIACLAFRDRVALESWGVRMTFGKMRQEAEKVTSFLQQMGLRPCARVAVMMPNVLPYPVCVLGITFGGYVLVNVNPLYTARELEHQLNDAKVDALFVLEPFLHVVEQVRHRLSVSLVVNVKLSTYLGAKGQLLRAAAKCLKGAIPAASDLGVISFEEARCIGARRAAVPVSVDPSTPALLQYTGGTTGLSKGAVITHGNIAAHTRQVSLWCREIVEQKPRHTMITALPIYHAVAFMNCLVMILHLGGCCVLIANPRDIPGFVKKLRRTRFTMMAGVNTLYNALSLAPGIERVDFSECVNFGIGGAATQRVVDERWFKLTGKHVTEAYGMSEAAACITFNLPGGQVFSGAIGYPTPMTDVAIRSDSGEDLPAGEVGEICASGPQIMTGYWNRPDETRAMFTDDGFMRTGDLGYMQDDGSVVLVDRCKDMILVSGFNVFPTEVEGVLAEHPAVFECAVVGEPSEDSGEAVVAHVVLKDSSATATTLMKHCYEHLTPYKVPRRFVFTKELPKSNVGKILRRELRDKVIH